MLEEKKRIEKEISVNLLFGVSGKHYLRIACGGAFG